MKQITFLFFLACTSSVAFPQETDTPLLKELAENGCKCVDSISTYNKSTKEVSDEISKCISAQTGAYQLGEKIMNIKDLEKDAPEADEKKHIDISVDFNQDSKEFKKYYYDMERYMLAHCKAMKEKMASNEKQSNKSVSENPAALEFYSKGLKASEKENYKKAISYFEKALETDAEFAFAWDNIGICYRKLGDYDKAIEAYTKSLELDPYGLMPLQNIAIAYRYKKEYDKAISSYLKFAEVDQNNPEVYYGLGETYAIYMKDYEKGLDNICKAYNLYIEQKSPYRSDAEKIINLIFNEMKNQGKEDLFNSILKENNISTD